MPMRNKVFSVLMLAVLAFAMIGAANPTRFERLGHAMMCTCGCNQILLECNHVGCPSSEGMRNELSAAMASNSSDSAVFDQFVAKYGPPVLAAPLATGFGRVAWLTPFAILALAILGCVYLVRVWKSRTSPAGSAAAVENSPHADELRMQARRETGLEHEL